MTPGKKDIMQPNPPPGAVKHGRFAHVVFCCLPLMLFALLAAGVYARGYWLALPIVFLMIIVPVLDLVTGWQDSVHFEKNEFSAWELFVLNWNTRLYALCYMGSVVYFALNIRRFNPVEIGLIIGCSSLLGGICFAAAHELLHAKENTDQVLQRLITTFLFYPHYKVIHVRSHHVNVGTTEDENTAWLNESIYAYIYRTIPGSMARSWHLEAKRIFNAERSALLGIIRNKMVLYAVNQVALLAGLYLISGWAGLLFYVAQIIGSHIVLESVNYIQHYGLMREQSQGSYEKTGAEHSWDTYHYFSSYAAFRVGHHSYHHLAVKPYYLLGTEAEAPKLPAGYFWAIPMVMLPPWWRRVINPKLKVATA